VPSLWILYAFFSSSVHRVAIIDSSYGRLGSSSPSSASAKNAFATFLDESDGGEDYYFSAARILTYQLLHANATKSRNPTPFIVLVTPGVADHKREQLRADGAIVVQAETIKLPWWIFSTVSRWKHQFSKLRLLQMTQYERVCFIDADNVVTRPMDEVFADKAVQNQDTLFYTRKEAIRGDEAQLPAQYVFSARTDNRFGGKRNHPVPPPSADTFSAGFWVAAPSQELFEYLTSIIRHPWRFSPQTMEQSLFNYAFRRDGPMPWQEMDYIWSATYPNEADYEGGVATLHEKYWMGRGPQILQDLWWQKKNEMELYFAARTQNT
jgi:alpha-N-acetylglucosamine transferase